MYWISPGQDFGNDGMPGFMVRRVTPFFFWHDDRTPLHTHDDFVFGQFELALARGADIGTARTMAVNTLVALEVALNDTVSEGDLVAVIEAEEQPSAAGDASAPGEAAR